MKIENLWDAADLPRRLLLPPYRLPEGERGLQRRGRVEGEKIPGYRSAVIVEDDCQPGLSTLPVFVHDPDIQLRKQHELSQTDFDAYTERLQSLAVKYPQRVQVVFSVADLKTQFQPGDEVWLPSFTMDGKPRFLGPPDQKPDNKPLLIS